MLVLQTMATPPAWTLAELPDLPLVVWAAHRRSTVPRGVRPCEHHDRGRDGGDADADERARSGEAAVRARGRPRRGLRAGAREALSRRGGGDTGAAIARVARRRRRRTAMRASTRPARSSHEKLGVEVVAARAAEVKEAYDAVTDERTAAMLDETRGLYDVEARRRGVATLAARGLRDRGPRRRARARRGRDELPRAGDQVRRHRRDAVLRPRPLGVARRALDLHGRCAHGGRDARRQGARRRRAVPRARDATTTKRTSSSSRARASTTSALAPGVRPALIENSWFAGDAITGVCACFSAPAGPGDAALGRRRRRRLPADRGDRRVHRPRHSRRPELRMPAFASTAGSTAGPTGVASARTTTPRRRRARSPAAAAACARFLGIESATA